MEKSSRKKNTLLNLLTGFASQPILTVMKFITRTVFISVLGKSYLGINGLFSDILTMLSMSELGLAAAINYYLYKPLAQKDEQRVRVLLKFYRQAYTVVGCVILLGGSCLIPFLPLLINDYDTLAPLGISATHIFLLYLSQSASSYLFFAYRSAVIKADQKRYIIDIVEFCVAIATNLAQILVLTVWKDFTLYTTVVIFFNILSNLISATIARKMYPAYFRKEKASLSFAEIKELFKDCGSLFVYKVNNIVIKATDNLVLSAFIGLSVVGQYSNYLLIYTAIKNILNKFYTAVKASMGNLFATKDIQTTYFFFEIMNYVTMVFFGTAAVGFAVCANEVIEVWIGMEYVIAQPLSILIGLEILLMGIKMNLGQIRSISGVFRQMWYTPLISIIINVGVSVALVNVWGIYGVVTGTLAANFFANVLIDPTMIYKHSFKNERSVWDYYSKNIRYVLLLTAVLLADMWFCSQVFVGHGWSSVMVHVIFTGMSVPAALVLCYWNTGECKYLRDFAMQMFKKIVKRKK